MTCVIEYVKAKSFFVNLMMGKWIDPCKEQCYVKYSHDAMLEKLEPYCLGNHTL